MQQDRTGSPGGRGTGRVDAARARIERAVERIERAAAARRHAEPGSADSQAADGQLLATLDAVRAEHAALQETTRTVRTGLDRTIRRIEEILES